MSFSQHYGRYQQRSKNQALESSNAALMGLSGGYYGGLSRSTTRQNQQLDSSYSHQETLNKASKQRLNPKCIERLRMKLKGRGTHGIHGIGRLFRIMDDNGDKKLSREEFSYGLSDFGINMNKVEVEELFSYIDRDKSGTISFDELLRSLRGPLNPERLVLIDMAYDKLDRNNDGQVTVEDLELYYDPSYIPEVRSGKQTPADALREFLSQWDTIEADGVVTKEEFREYYKNVSASIDNDKYFELMMRNAWGLAGGEGQCENTALKRVLVTHADGSQSVEQIDEQAGITSTKTRSLSNDDIRNELHGKGVIAVKVERLSDGENESQLAPLDDGRTEKTLDVAATIGRRGIEIHRSSGSGVQHPSIDRGFVDDRIEDTSAGQVPNYFMSTAQRMNRLRSECQGIQAKAHVPDWVRFDKVQLQFRMYSKEPIQSHNGVFNASTRAYDSVPSTTFILRKFVATIYLEDNTISIAEVSENRNEFGSASFMRRVKMGTLKNTSKSEPYTLEDFTIGNLLSFKGKSFCIYDMDKRTRQFYAENLPRLVQKQAIALPEKPQEPPASPPPSSTRRQSRRRSSTSGIVLKYYCQWDDSSGGERVTSHDQGPRKFHLLYYLDNSTMELREVNPRNSGRGRVSLFNLRRQTLINPETPDNHPYVPEDITIHSKVEVFGRSLLVTGCSESTHRFCREEGIEFGQRTEEEEEASSNKEATALGLYSSPEQHMEQVIRGIQSQVEQATNYASRAQNVHRLVHHMVRNIDNNGKLSRESFHRAMGTFSVFGSDADELYHNHFAPSPQSMENTLLEEKEEVAAGYQAHSRNSWFDEDSDEVERKHTREMIDQFAQMIFPEPTGFPSVATKGDENHMKDQMRKDSRLKGLLNSLKAKLESLTNFGDDYQARQKLLSVLRLFDSNRDGTISRNEFRGALAKFNFWTRDADYVFDMLDKDKNGTLGYNEFVALCMS